MSEFLPSNVVETYWDTQLPRLDNECEHVPIFYRNECHLCGLVGKRFAMTQHCQDPSHVQKMCALRKIQNQRRQTCKKLYDLFREARLQESKINQLPEESWKASLRAELFPYHTWDVDYKELPDSLPSIEKSRQTFLQGERYAILKLAAWKSFIFANYYDRSFGIVETLQFFNHGWKEYKKDMPRNKIAAISIIMSHVKKFVGDP